MTHSLLLTTTIPHLPIYPSVLSSFTRARCLQDFGRSMYRRTTASLPWAIIITGEPSFSSSQSSSYLTAVSSSPGFREVSEKAAVKCRAKWSSTTA